jgi:hypothetical protein
MLMRFHWGLGVGHLYSHDDQQGTGEALVESLIARPPASRQQNDVSTDAVRDDAQQTPEPVTPRQQTPDEEEHANEDDLDIVREAEAELNHDLRQLSPAENGEVPEFLRDDDEEIEEDADDAHQLEVFG